LNALNAGGSNLSGRSVYGRRITGSVMRSVLGITSQKTMIRML